MEEEEGSAVFSLPQVELVTEDTLQETVEEPLDAQECEILPDMDDSELVNGYPLGEEEVAVGFEEAAPTAADEAMSTAEVETEAAEAEVEIEAAEAEAETETEAAEAEAEAEAETETEAAEASRGGGKRKRGRPSRVLLKAPSKKKEEEDVCFICFDGGKLVLCDRRGCPKAYHPACVNRDEAFFRSKGRWNCGWHICSNCEKNAHFMCYTCTYSLCKGCIKETEFFCIRENKGLCETCMRTVMLIEKNERGNREMSQVDFDDKNSWEYLFKEYWVDLKGKLLLTSDELTQARNPWKGSGISVQKEESSDESYDASGGQGCNSDSSSGHLELSNPKKRKLKRRSKMFKESVPNESRVVGSEGAAMLNDAEWASKELLDLVAHMRNGDTSTLSQFDVQALLLEYIKQNNLRDPRRKSQIVCDSRLENLFGKPRVGHFEMLKLLESHFIIKEETPADDAQDDIVAADTSQLEADGSGDALTKVGMDRRRKSRKKGEERAPQTNLDDYAAIDVHNINLLYLRRNLMEDLLEDSERFHDRVVGSFVRIRISGSGQKQDMYRLVQVVGTRKAQESYKTGKRSTDVLLEILNLNKTEVIAIDIISNQDFTEDECKRLRQSIKCGLIGRMTVGEVQEKALALQEVRVNDWLETEKLRLSHLRDRASETGRRKELRECVEKLQLLNTTEERSRRLQEIPDVHDDPNMDPNYESEEDEGEQDAKKQDYYPRQREAGFGRKAREAISPGKGSSAVRTWDGARKNPNVTWEPSKNMHAKGGWDKGVTGDRVVESSWSEGSDMHQSDSWGKSKNQAPVSGSDAGPWSGQTVLRPGSSGTALETAVTPLPSGLELSVNFSETDKIWHYKDPSGKIQGPFSMVQIRKWSTTGYFPVDLKIWRTMEKQEDSILLNDALAGKFYKELSQQENSFSQPPKGVLSDSNRENKWGGGWKENTNSIWTDKNEIDRSWSSTGKDATIPANGNNVLLKSDGRGSGSSGWAVSTPNLKVGQSAYPSPGWDSSRGNNVWSGASVHSPNPSPSLSVPKNLAPFNQEVQGGVRWNAAQNSGNTWNSNRSTVLQSNSGHSHEKQINNLGYPGISSGDNWRFQPESSSLRGSATAASVETPKFAAGGWAAEKGYDNNSLNLPSPTPEPSSAGWTGQVSEKNWSAASSLPGQPATSVPETNPDMGGNLAQHTPLGITGTKKSASWSEHHHAHDTPARGWDTSSVSGSMHKPSETAGLVDQRDFYDPPSPTPKTNVGGWSGSQGAENRYDMLTTSLHEKIIGSGSVPIAGGIVAQKSSPKVNEPLKVSDEWGRQPPNTVKSSSGEWDTGATSASVLKQAEMISSDTVAPFPESGQLPHPSASNMLLKPTDGLDGSLASPNSQIAGSVPDARNYSTDQSASSIHSKDDDLTSSSGLTSPHSVKGAADLTKGSKNDPSNSLKVLSPKINPGVGPRPDDASGNISIETKEFAPSSLESALAGIGNVVSTSDIAPPTKTVDPTVSAWVSSNDSHLLQEVRERGSGYAQTLEVDGTPRLESQGWQPIPAKKVEPPNSGSRPALATQKLGPMDVIHRGDGQSSMRNLATSFSTVGQALDQPISGSLVSNPAPSENFAGPANPNDSSWSMPSAAMPLSLNASPVPAMNNNQNKKSFARSDGQKPGNQWESGINMQPSSSVNPVRGMSVDENQNSGLRVAPENPSILPPQGNANMGWGVPARGNASTGWGAAAQASNITGQGTLPQGDANMGWGVGATDTGMWGTHSGDRFSGPDQGFHGGDVGRGGGSGGGGRPLWNRQSSFGSGGGRGGFSRPHNKAQRVCKFHESGHCKKGADCDYLHP